MDPISDIIIAAAVGAVTTQTVGGIAALVKSIVPGLWEHLSPKGKKQLETNLTNFMNHFKSEVQHRTEAGQLSEEQIHALEDDPAVIDLLLRTLEQAALTSDADKQTLLAKLLAERLGTDTDSELALVSRMACNTIPNLSGQQLKIIAVRYILFFQRYNETIESQSDDVSTRRLREVEWLISMFEPYQDIIASTHDAEHLAGVGCFFGKQGFLAYELKSTLTQMVSPDLDLDMVMKTATWQHLETVWNNARLAGFDLTSVGSMLGMYTSDILANRPNDVDKWLNRS